MDFTSSSQPKLQKQTRRTVLILFLTPAIFLWGAPRAGAVRPLSATLAAVAGDEGREGFQDGSFTSALFKRPLGLAVSEDGTQLFVADSGNNRIRVIHLDQDNNVSTLAGKDSAGNLDGPLTLAQFNDPKGVLALPGGRLVVNDFGNELLRLVDLKAGTVVTLAGGQATPGLTPTPSVSATPSTIPARQASLKGVNAMAYLPAADAILFTQPDSGSLKALNLKTGLVSTLLNDHPQVSNPAALVCQGEKIYLADRNQAKLYEMDWRDKAPVTLLPVGDTLGKVLSLSLNGNILYALLQNPGVPAQRFFLDKKNGAYNEQFNRQLVSLRNPWGDKIPPEYLFPPRELSFSPSIGFAADPGDIRKFYVSKPEYNLIVTFRDLFGFDWSPQAGDYNTNGLSAPEYPARKPKNTYRIIIVGDSRSAEVQPYPLKTDVHTPITTGYPHNLSFAPQTEGELNFQAALDGVQWNYEVFNFGRHGEFLIWPTFDVPKVVQKNDIDLVIIFMPRAYGDWMPYESYFDHPLTKDGIPQYPNDMEYLLKPPLQRISKGLCRTFYDFCKANDLVQISGNHFHFDEKLITYPQLRDSLLEFYGRPLDVLNRKLSAMKTSDGKPVRLLLLSAYTGRGFTRKYDTQLWIDAAKKFNFPYLDLNPEMNAMHLTYVPLTGDETHLNPEGSVFFSRLLAHDLIRDKLIPWDKETQP